MADLNPYSPIIDTSNDTSLREVVRPLFRRKRVLISTFCVAFGVLLLIAIFLPATYKSSMAVLVSRERIDPLMTTESTTQMPSGGTGAVTLEEINSEAELLVSNDILTKVVLAAGLDRPGHSWLSKILPAKTEPERVEKAVTILAKQLQVKNATNSNLIEVSYASSNPKTAYAVLSALGDFYVEKHVQVHRPAGSYEFFADEAKKYHDALQASEDKLRTFSRDKDVAAPDVVRTYLAQTLAISMGQLNGVEQAIAADTERIRSDQARLSQTPHRVSTMEAVTPADKLLEDLHSSLLAAQTKRTLLASKYDSNYPSVKEADEEIAQTQAAIASAEKTNYVTKNTDVDPTYELIREDLAKTEADLAAQRAGAASAKSGIENMRAQMVDLDQNALTQQDLLREAKANEDNYLLYLGKREQERTSDALDRTKIGNVTIAVPPGIPVLPVYSIKLLMVLAFAVAFVLSIGAAYTVDYFDTSFHSPAQVVDILGIPVVVTVSKKRA